MGLILKCVQFEHIIYIFCVMPEIRNILQKMIQNFAKSREIQMGQATCRSPVFFVQGKRQVIFHSSALTVSTSIPVQIYCLLCVLPEFVANSALSLSGQTHGMYQQRTRSQPGGQGHSELEPLAW